MSSDKNDLGVAMEHMDSQFAMLAEMITQTREEMARKDDLEEVKADVKVIKAVLTDQSDQLSGHEQRITHLEAA